MTTDALKVEVRRSVIDPNGYDVLVPVPCGGDIRRAVVPVRWDQHRDVFTIEVSGELLDQATEGVTAAVQIAFRSIAGERR